MTDDEIAELVAESLRLYKAGQELRDRREWSDALALFRRSLECEERIPLDRRSSGGYGCTLHELAAALAALGDKTGALEHFRQAREWKARVPDEQQDWENYSKTLHELGFVLYGAEQYAEALEVLNASLEANRHLSGDAREIADAATLLYLGRCHGALGNWQAAADAYAAESKAARHDANFVAGAHYRHAYALVELGELERAQASLEAAQQTFDAIPRDGRAFDVQARSLRELAFVHEELGNEEQARAARRRAIKAHITARSLDCSDDT